MVRKTLTVLCVVILCAFLAVPVSAQGPTPPPPDPITKIFQYIIQFPTDSLVEALTKALQAILSGSIEPLEQVFSASLVRWVTTSPGIITPGGGIVDGVDVMVPTWNLTSRIAILLWPLTLAITAIVAAKDVITAGKWGIGDLKQALGTWLIAVIASATSLYWMDLANRFVNATTTAILNLDFFGASGFDPNLLTTILIGSAVAVLGMTGLGLIIAIIIIVIGISILASLIFQFLARYALLYVLVALAPIVIMLGVLPPLRWFTTTWARGFVMVLVIGPINALLLKLVILLGARGLSDDPITAFVNFMAAAGVLSALLAINYTLIQFVFGAFGQVMERAVGTVTAVGSLALAAAGGVAAAGAVGAAGSRAGSMAGTSRGVGVGLETAGSILSRSGGMGHGLGAALWGVGNAMRHRDAGIGSTNGATQSRRTDTQYAPNGTEPSKNGSTATSNSASPSSTSMVPPNDEPTNPPVASTSTAIPTPGANPGDSTIPTSVARANPHSKTTPPQPNGTVVKPVPTQAAKSQPQNLGVPSQASPTNLRPNQTMPNVNRDNTEAVQGDYPRDETSTPILQTTPISDETQPNANPVQTEPATGVGPRDQAPAHVSATIPHTAAPRPNLNLQNAQQSTRITPQAQALVQLLDAPLGERVRSLTEHYASPAEQLRTAQGAVAALSTLEAHHNVEPQLLASSWDQIMGSVVVSAREGLSMETMANDAGYRGDVTQFIGARVESGLLAARPSAQQPLFPRVESPNTMPWHPQIAPHDVEVGQQLATMLGAPPQEALNFAHIYHSVRSPENGGGWQAGMSLREAAQQVTQLEPANRLGALDARLHTMEQKGVVSSNGLRLWRVHLARKQNTKG